MNTLMYGGALLGLLAAAACAQGQAADAPPDATTGLCVSNGVFVLGGVPYRGVGVNYFSLFSRALRDPADRSYEDGLRRLAEAGVPFARFMACGFWPSDWDLYLRDKPAYFARLDAVVRCAERVGVGLIPSLFWHMPTVPDIVGEPIDQLGEPGSRTSAFIREYTREVVARYRGSRAVWAWEFGNEYALAADLPNADRHRPAVWPALKTAPSRSARDELTSRAMLAAFGVFAEAARSLDARRPLVTGNALPRPHAYHNTLERSWRPDTPAQFEEVLLRDNPDPFDTLSVHLYPRGEGKVAYPGGAESAGALVAGLQAAARKAGKPLFIGEFGASATAGPEEERARFEELADAIEAHGVPLAALWVYDLPQQDKEWNVTFANRRAYMLRRVGEANRAAGARGARGP